MSEERTFTAEELAAIDARIRGLVGTYPMPARFQEPDYAVDTRRSDTLGHLTTELLEGGIDLPDYKKLWLESQADLNAHAETFERILKDGRFAPLFLLDLLDSYPYGRELYNDMIKDAMPAMEAAFAKTIDSLPFEGMTTLLRYKFGLPTEKGAVETAATRIPLIRLSGYLIDGETRYPIFKSRFDTADQSVAEHKKALDHLMDHYQLTEDEQKQGLTLAGRLGELVRDYLHGAELFDLYRGTERGDYLEKALRPLFAGGSEATWLREYGLSPIGRGPARVTSPGSRPILPGSVRRATSPLRR